MLLKGHYRLYLFGEIFIFLSFRSFYLSAAELYKLYSKNSWYAIVYEYI